jgi:RNA polymerase sigma-70 factor (ECF subfamily)
MSTPVPIALSGATRDFASGAAARDDCRDAFEEIVRNHGAALFALAARLTASRNDAEDLAQEALLRAWRSIHRFRGEADVRTWLYRIVVNAHRSMWKRPSLALMTDDIPQPGRGPVEAASRRDLLSRVLRAIDALPKRQRQSILLRVRGGLSIAEIAAVMTIGRGAVKSHLVHARRKLFRRFGAEIGEWGIA